jgi:hypothetical protein
VEEVERLVGVGVVVRGGTVVDPVVAVEAVVRAGVGVGVNRETGVGVILTVGAGVSLSGDADLFSETVSDVDRFVTVASDRVVAKAGATATEKIESKIATMAPYATTFFPVVRASCFFIVLTTTAPIYHIMHKKRALRLKNIYSIVQYSFNHRPDI